VIKRQYFTYAEIHLKDGRVKQSFRQHYYTSWISNPEAVLNDISERLAKQSGVKESEVVIKAFNRV